MKHIWHKNMQEGHLKLLAPFKRQGVALKDSRRQCPSCGCRTAAGMYMLPLQGKQLGVKERCPGPYTQCSCIVQICLMGHGAKCFLCTEHKLLYVPLPLAFSPLASKGTHDWSMWLQEQCCGTVLKTPPGKRNRA